MEARESRALQRNESDQGRAIAPVWHSRAFWDEVEYEVEAPDPYDLLEFLTADERPISARPGFRTELRDELAVLVRRRYQQ